MKTGLYVGRFQPFHIGHLSMIEFIAKETDKLIIAIGSSDKEHTADNPFTAKERAEMIEAALPKDLNYSIVPVPDIGDYERWVGHLAALTPQFDFVYTGNKIVRELFEKENFEVRGVKHFHTISATEIREMMSNGADWQQYVPEETVKRLDDIRGPARVKKLLNKPAVTVDVILENKEGILLIERANPPYGWALPGGFVDYGEKVEDAAAREGKEETSLYVYDLELFGVYSDPIRDPRCHAVSVVFKAKSKGEARAADDAKNLKRFKRDELPALAFDHDKILEDYIKKHDGP